MEGLQLGRQHMNRNSQVVSASTPSSSIALRNYESKVSHFALMETLLVPKQVLKRYALLFSTHLFSSTFFHIFKLFSQQI
jgi:hypothetical protein